MPIITVELKTGRTLEQRAAFARAVTRAAVEHLDAVPDRVRIRFDEFATDAVAQGGALMSEQA
ncbi:MAG: tautomerase family protein, partial [Dehalococcoidia bacterium]